MNRILAPIAIAGVLAAAAIGTSPQSALAATAAFSDGGEGSCGAGSKVECGSTTTYKCTSLIAQPSLSPTGISITYVCASSITQTSKSYKD